MNDFIAWTLRNFDFNLLSEANFSVTMIYTLCDAPVINNFNLLSEANFSVTSTGLNIDVDATVDFNLLSEANFSVTVIGHLIIHAQLIFQSSF